MKLRHVLLVLGLGTGLTSQAQSRMPVRKAATPHPKMAAKGETMKDGFVLKDNRVLMTRGGQTSPLLRDEALPSGVKVAANGAVTLANGQTMQLREGDQLSPTGRLTTAASLAEQDSLQQAKLLKSKPKGKAKRR